MGSLAKAPDLPVSSDDNRERWLRAISRSVHQIFQGKTSNTGSATLDADATSTVIADPRIGANSVLHIMPTTLNAGAALSAWAVQNRTAGSATISHVSTSTSDCVFAYAVIG